MLRHPKSTKANIGRKWHNLAAYLAGPALSNSAGFRTDEIRRGDAHSLAGSEICGQNAPQEPRFYGGCGADAGARHRRQHRYLQRGRCRAPAAVAVQGCRPPGFHRTGRSSDQGERSSFVLHQVHRDSGAEPHSGEYRGVLFVGFRAGNRAGAGNCFWSAGFRGFFPGAGSQPGPRQEFPSEGGRTGRRGRRHRERRLLAQPLRRQRRTSRPNSDARRQECHGRRNSAAQFSLSAAVSRTRSVGSAGL